MEALKQEDFFWEETGQGKLFPEQPKLPFGSLEVIPIDVPPIHLSSVGVSLSTLSRDLRKLCYRNSTGGCLEVVLSMGPGNSLTISRVEFLP